MLPHFFFTPLPPPFVLGNSSNSYPFISQWQKVPVVKTPTRLTAQPLRHHLMERGRLAGFSSQNSNAISIPRLLTRDANSTGLTLGVGSPTCIIGNPLSRSGHIFSRYAVAMCDFAGPVKVLFLGIHDGVILDGLNSVCVAPCHFA